MIAIEQFTL